MNKCKKIVLFFLMLLLILGMSSTIYAATYKSKYKEPTITLRQGASGDSVKWLQDMLKQNGYSISIDGKFGSGTKNIVEAFQKANKIKADGIVGTQTRNLLKTKATGLASNTTTKKPTSSAAYTSKYPEPKTTLRKGASGDYVRWLQDMLKHNGYSINIDGKFGVGTENIVEAFQKANKIKADGIVGTQTRNLLKTKATGSVSNTTTKQTTTSPTVQGYDKKITITIQRKVGNKNFNTYRTYLIYRQDRYSEYKFWDDSIATDGCGPTSVAIVASGYNKDVDPVDVAQYMKLGSFDQISKALDRLNIAHSELKMVKQVDVAVNEIKAALMAGQPVIVSVAKSTANVSDKSRYTGAGHFMVLLGGKLIDKGNDMELIIGQPSEDKGRKGETGTLKDLVNNYMFNVSPKKRNRGYMIITEI